jgi:hypothetical protein
VAEGAAFWAWHYVIGYLPRIVDDPIAPELRGARLHVLKVLRTYLAVTAEHAYLAGMREVILRLEEWLSNRDAGDMAELSPFPAFR